MDFVFDEVVSIEDFECDSLRYDITVSDNHNFFANEVLVHNCQNLIEEFKGWADIEWEVTEKLDGSSMTVYRRNGEIGVCSRNWDLKETESNTLWRVAHSSGVTEVLMGVWNDLAIQGELIGEGIQGNKYGIRGQEFHIFDIYIIHAGRYMTPQERQNFVRDHDLTHVPVIWTNAVPASIEECLQLADGPSHLNPKTLREGLVFKAVDGKVSFKAISNKWLMKND